ncbi:MAG: 16S rRNA (cytosine(967)-C(5))-methyltransferase RsmB [Eubacterium sp.]|jgi:16S rRNA (cytosine967-C5)-methyltransferase|nr:16S rRNA (cytosine(967)-C(5))-methyltransferase RsmB [Eubacterium sp.]MCH4078643.1 16S rRNA (cytosine(967)-C(5))-methyltransferase RsmB [Eubacterium sp.]MCH4109784.1 16S rRNA (cytosine(967)-C(5))-methyltransferase RsmB [Eubacterium sp.]MCI1306992.1 16S rRNA (cytosine(967)-C(5))-methyltransferase RsmB [Eubacterium sp.]MCI1428118.1 16S rRNA (cytosine(967)-C(5))-methyltransferase RsmB [Eubacterium sp.]
MDRNRKAAYQTLMRVVKDQAYSNIEVSRQIERCRADAPAFVREIVYGTQQQWLYLDYLLKQLVSRGYSKMKPQVSVLLHMGAYQILFMDSVPDYAAVNSCAEMASSVCRPQKGFINAVLRNLIRQKDSLKQPESEKNPVSRMSAEYSADPWIAALLIRQRGEEEAENILRAMSETPPLCIVVNTLKTDRESLKNALTGQGFSVDPVDVKGLSDALPVLAVKGSGLMNTEEFHKGWFYVQDPASAAAVSSLAPEAGETVMDVCGAPGGKSMAAAILMGNRGSVRTFDYYEHKLSLIRRQADRLGIRCVKAEKRDALSAAGTLTEKADAVICDVPCSGLGVLRRKPEIRYRKLDDDARALAVKQLAILERSSELVKPGGRIMYSTCTINRIENENNVEAFLRQQEGKFQKEAERQLLPGLDGTDGFYFCIMRRMSK